MVKGAKILDWIFVSLIVVWLVTLASVLLPYSYYDADKPSQWKMQHSWDEGQNIARVQSLVTTPDSENKILSPQTPQFYLRLAAFAQRFFPQKYDLQERSLLALRIGALFNFLIYILGFYFVCRQVAPPLASFWAWLSFASASWIYFPMASTGKEDAFCALLVLIVFSLFFSFFKQRSRWKLIIAGAFIGVGGATKEYPLLLSLAFPLIFCHLESSWQTRLKRTFLFALLVGGAMFAVSPQYYFSKQAFGVAIKDLLFSQQALNDKWTQVTYALKIIEDVLIVRHRELWLALIGLWLANKLKWKSTGPEFEAHQFLLRHRSSILLFAVLYYCISLYKQNLISSVRYFMIGEIGLSLVLAIALERLFLFYKDMRALVWVSVVFAVFFTFNLRRGNFNYALQISTKEQSLREAWHSTSKVMTEKIKILPEERRKKLLSSWYVYIPPELRPTYVHRIDTGYEFAEPYLKPVYGYDFLNEDISPELVKRERATLFVSSYTLPDVPMYSCFKLIEYVFGEHPNLYINFISSVNNFHRARVFLRPGNALIAPSGTNLYLYDTRGCL